MSITGGTIHFTKRHKTGDYEHHDTGVSFNFSVDDNTPLSKALEIAQIIGDQAKAQVFALATGRALNAIPQQTVVDTKPAGPTQVNDKRRSGRPPNVTKTDVTPGPTSAGTPPAASSPSGSTASASAAADPTSFLDGVDPAKVAAADAAAKAPAEDWNEPVEEVKTLTDAELNAKVTHINGKIKNSLVIRQLIAKFATSTPKNLSGIPAAARAEFIVELEKL